MTEGSPTLRLILFGTRSALGRHLPQAEVIFEYRSADSAGPAQDRQEYREGFFRYHDLLWNCIDLRNDKQSYQDGFFRVDIPTFDEKIAREAILNAISPGGLPSRGFNSTRTEYSNGAAASIAKQTKNYYSSTSGVVTTWVRH